MKESAEGRYTVSLSFPVGSLVKYRYMTNDGQNRFEYSSSGYPIRARLFYVDGPCEVQDTIARWQNTKFKGLTGRLFGSITDVDTGEAISNVVVSAAGLYTLSRPDGSFDLYNVPQGTHMVSYTTLDGAYLPFKQYAVIVSDMATPASVSISEQELVEVRFTVEVPEDTVNGAPVRIAGNLWQFGYLMSEQIDGSGILAMRMPVMEYQGDFTYTYTTLLPAGADLHYKYTLGDGFWSSEHTLDGKFALRQLIVPADSSVLNIDDTVLTFDSSTAEAIWFDVTAPGVTPQEDNLYIQFKLLDWMPPIPMWYGGENRWGFRYSSPTNISGNLEYRYCRNGICGAETALAVEISLPQICRNQSAGDAGLYRYYRLLVFPGWS